MSFQALIQFLLPKEDHFYVMLEELGQLAYESAVTLQRFQDQDVLAVQTAVQSVEHRADDVVRRMEEALSRTFVTPIDREDLHKLTSELDDVIDLANLTARAYSLFAIEKPSEAMLQMMEKLVSVTAILRDTVPLLRKKDVAGLLENGRKVRQIEKEADTIYRSSISGLFRATSIDFRELLKQKEALDDLENAVDQADNVADLLSNLAVKHG